MTDSKRPVTLTIAVILVWLEATASLIYGALQALNLIFQGAKDVGGAISVIAFFVLVAGWLFFSAVKLLSGARWARSAILFWQFMQIAVASATFDSMAGRIPANIPVGIAAMAPAIVIVVLLFTKKVIRLTAKDPAGE